MKSVYFLQAPRITKQAAVFLLFLFAVFNGRSASLFSDKRVAETTAMPMIRLQMSGPANQLDETVIYYQEGASPGFDAAYDSYKLNGPNPAAHIAQEYNAVRMAINGIAPVSSTFSINLLTTTNATGSFTIAASDFEALPAGTSVYLKDRVKGTTVNIITGSYVFVLSDTTTVARFVLLITHVNTATGLVSETSSSARLADMGDNHFKAASLPALASDLFVSVVNLEGKTVLQLQIAPAKDLILDFSTLQPGMYVLSMTAENKMLLYSKIFVR